MSCRVMLCYVMLCYVMLCYVILYYIILCYVILYYIILYYIILYYIITENSDNKPRGLFLAKRPFRNFFSHIRGGGGLYMDEYLRFQKGYLLFKHL